MLGKYTTENACIEKEQGVTFDEVAIGRVLTTERGKGYGNLILKAGIETAREKFLADKIRIEAQVYASGFYEKLALAFYPFIRWEKCIVPFGIIKIVWLFLSKML